MSIEVKALGAFLVVATIFVAYQFISYALFQRKMKKRREQINNNRWN